MNDEIWVSAYGWAGLYEVSNLGRIRSIRRKGKTMLGNRIYGGSIVKPIFHKTTKYLVVNLTGNGKRKQALVHRLILESFSGKCPDGKEACHNDGNRLNPALLNLRWDTKKNNSADKKLHGTWHGGENNPISKLTDEIVIDIRGSDLSIDALAKKYSVSHGCIKKAKYKDTWRHL